MSVSNAIGDRPPITEILLYDSRIDLEWENALSTYETFDRETKVCLSQEISAFRDSLAQILREVRGVRPRYTCLVLCFVLIRCRCMLFGHRSEAQVMEGRLDEVLLCHTQMLASLGDTLGTSLRDADRDSVESALARLETGAPNDTDDDMRAWQRLEVALNVRGADAALLQVRKLRDQLIAVIGQFSQLETERLECERALGTQSFREIARQAQSAVGLQNRLDRQEAVLRKIAGALQVDIHEIDSGEAVADAILAHCEDTKSPTIDDLSDMLQAVENAMGRLG